MTPRHVPPKLAERGIERIFESRGLDLEMFKFLVKAELKDAPIAKALSADKLRRTGIEIHISPRTIKGYRKLL